MAAPQSLPARSCSRVCMTSSQSGWPAHGQRRRRWLARQSNLQSKRGALLQRMTAEDPVLLPQGPPSARSKATRGQREQDPVVPAKAGCHSGSSGSNPRVLNQLRAESIGVPTHYQPCAPAQTHQRNCHNCPTRSPSSREPFGIVAPAPSCLPGKEPVSSWCRRRQARAGCAGGGDQDSGPGGEPGGGM